MVMNSSNVISLISKIREKINRLITAEMSERGIEDLATSHGDIIDALYSKPQMTMAEIAAKIGKDKSTVTALVDKLVRLGYVTKERDTLDTRVVYVTLTKKGNDLKPAFIEISKKVLDTVYLNIAENDKEELMRILEKIYLNL